MKRKKTQKNSPLVGLILALILSLFIGTVMTFGQHYWRKPIPQSEAVHYTATYDSFQEESPGRFITYGPTILRFSDHDIANIDVECVTPYLLSRLEELHPGQTLEVWQHPNSHTVLALSADGEEILNYQRAQPALRKGNIGFLILGIFLYLTAALAAFGLFVTIRHRKSLPYRTSPRHHPAIHRH